MSQVWGCSSRRGSAWGGVVVVFGGVNRDAFWGMDMSWLWRSCIQGKDGLHHVQDTAARHTLCSYCSDDDIKHAAGGLDMPWLS